MGTLDSTPAVDAAVRCHWQMDYTMTYGSVRLARMHTRRQLALWGWAGDQDDATLIVSELTTNAVSHGRAVGHLMGLRLAILEDGTLRIDVSDPVPSPPCADTDSRAGAEDECGRGLHLIRALGGSLSWFLREEGGKTVRAHLANQLPAPVRSLSPSDCRASDIVASPSPPQGGCLPPEKT